MNQAGKPAGEQAIDPEYLRRGPGKLPAFVVGAIVIGLTILLQLTPIDAAGGYPGKSVTDAGVATLVPGAGRLEGVPEHEWSGRSGIGSPLSAPQYTVQATEALTRTVWLPYIAKGFGLPYGLFGAQIWWVNSTAIDRMTEMGTRWARLPLSWRQIEPQNTTPQNYTWSVGFEQQLAALSAAHIQVILQFGDNPSWAATYLNGPIDLVDIVELTEFMQAVVARYSQPPYNVKYWEIYNEPDNGNVLFAEQGAGYFGYTPEAYVDVLEAVYQPIKAIDPGAKILLGGLAYDAWPDPFVEDFLDQVLIHGGAAYFDLMNFHYYVAFRANWEPYGREILGKLAYLRDKLAYYGVDKPIVCTETGWFSNSQGGDGNEIQCRQVVQAFIRGMVADMSFVIWFTLADSTIDLRQWGLIDVNFNPKPSYYAHQTLATQMSGVQYVRTLDPGQTGSDQIEAYEFATPRSCTVVVAWSNDITHEMEIPTPQLVVVDKFGAETILYDGDDGAVDGRVRVPIGASPVYLRPACGARKQK